MSRRSVAEQLGRLLAAGALTLALAIPARADHESIVVDGNLADLITAINNNLGSSQGGFKAADAVNVDVCTAICCYVNGFDAQNYYLFLDFKQPGGAVASNVRLYAGWDVVGLIGDTDGDGNPNTFNPILHPGCAISDPSAPGKIGNSESYTIEIDFDCDGAADMSLSVTGDGGVTKVMRTLPGPPVDITAQSAFAINNGFLELRIDNFQAIVSAALPDADLCHARITMTANSQNDGLGEDRSAVFPLDVPPSVKVTKTPSTQTVCPSGPVTWTIQVTNDGLCKLGTLTVDDTMDPGLIFDSSTPASTGDAQHRHWDFTNLVSGASQSITLNAHSGDVCVAPVLHNAVHATGSHTPPALCGEPEAAEASASADVNCSHPTVTLAPAGPLCIDASAIQLDGQPAGGTYSGTGVSAGGLFDPATAGVGSHVITYSFSDQNGCPGSAQQTIVVNGLPTVTLAAAGPLCSSAAAIQLNGQPAGGTYTGTGVSASGLFDPATAGPGSHVITYSFTDPNGCGGSAQRTIVVNGLPTVSLAPAGPLCIDASAIQLNGQPAGGTYGGTGVSASGVFDPATAGAGSHVITYSFTDPNGCPGSAQQTIVVNGLPTVTLAPAGPLCTDASAIQLDGQPAGGTYSGTGVSASGLFDPATAGVGSHVITYAFTDPNGCGASAQQTIVVNDVPSVTLAAAGPLCQDASPIQLNGQPAGGTYSGTGVSASGLFDPATAGPGSHVITYTFADQHSCGGSAQRTIVVNGLPTVTLDPAGPLCPGGAAIQLNGHPSGGTFSGTGVSPTGLFNPGNAGIGSIVITYSYTDPNGCGGSAQRTIVVTAGPTVTLAAAGPLCRDASAIQLSGLPPGGTYSGTGVNASGLFNPATAGPGNHVITYSFTDPDGCPGSAQRTIVVNGLPVVTLGPAGPLCNDVAPVQLNGQPAGGTYSGTGVSANGLFDPAIAGLGNHVITYSFTDANGCSNSASTSVAVQVCQQVCWLTAGGAKIAGAKGPAHSWGGNVYPGCSPTAGDGGNWNHNAHDLNLHLLGQHIEVIRCGNVDGIPPGSKSPKTPNNFIEFKGTGRLQGVAGNKADYPLVYFFSRCEDRSEPGSKGQPDPLFVDRYFLHVYLNPADPAGSTLLLVSGDANPNNVVPVPITDGNMQIHISSCAAVVVPQSAMVLDPPGTAGPQTGQQSQQAGQADEAPAAAQVTLRSDQPVPNPFTEMTRIAYDVIGETRDVQIGIYDLAGRKLRSLVSDRLEPGQYSVTWDGRTDRGDRAPRGMYFVRTEVRGQANSTRRVLYMK